MNINKIICIYSSLQMHYYQPMFTLVGGGIKTLEECGRPMKSVLPKNCDWIKSKAVNFDPENNKVTTQNGDEVNCISPTLQSLK